MQSSGSGTSRETVAAIIVAILVVAGILWVQSNGNNDGGEEVVAESAPPSLDAPATLDQSGFSSMCETEKPAGVSAALTFVSSASHGSLSQSVAVPASW